MRLVLLAFGFASALLMVTIVAGEAPYEESCATTMLISDLNGDDFKSGPAAGLAGVWTIQSTNSSDFDDGDQQMPRWTKGSQCLKNYLYGTDNGMEDKYAYGLFENCADASGEPVAYAGMFGGIYSTFCLPIGESAMIQAILPEHCPADKADISSFTSCNGGSPIVGGKVLAANRCPVCREVLEGSHKGNYTRKEAVNTNCPTDTDRCLYQLKDSEPAVNMCFKPDPVDGIDVMEHADQCPADAAGVPSAP